MVYTRTIRPVGIKCNTYIWLHKAKSTYRNIQRVIIGWEQKTDSTTTSSSQNNGMPSMHVSYILGMQLPNFFNFMEWSVFRLAGPNKIHLQFTFIFIIVIIWYAVYVNNNLIWSRIGTRFTHTAFYINVIFVKYFQLEHMVWCTCWELSHKIAHKKDWYMIRHCKNR